VYFTPTRNGYGMIGLVPLKRFSPENRSGADCEEPVFGGCAIAGADLCGGDELDL
jgi:arginine decarboxylase